MKRIIAFTAFFVFLNLTISAQNISLSMKAGMLNSKVKFDGSNDIVNNGHLKLRPTYALLIEGQLFDFIYIGAEIGTCSYSAFMDFKYDDYGSFLGNPKSQVTYFGWYQQEQSYFAISPQFKFGKTKWLSVGGGLGIYNNYINRFQNGTRTTRFDGKPNSEVLILDGSDMYSSNTVSGGFLNIGLNPKINKHLGVVIETRYIFNNPSNGQITKVKPNISFNSFAAMGGLSFHF